MEEKNEYNGKCPVCSGQLEVDGNLLKCMEEDHYVISQIIYEAAWEEYDSSAGTPLDAEALLQILLEGNTSSNKPEMKVVGRLSQ